MQIWEGVYKKRIAIKGKGKCGSMRTIVAYKAKDKVFFIFGYAKNKKSNITLEEKKVAKILAKEMLSYSYEELEYLIKVGSLFEVHYEK